MKFYLYACLAYTSHVIFMMKDVLKQSFGKVGSGGIFWHVQSGQINKWSICLWQHRCCSQSNISARCTRDRTSCMRCARCANGLLHCARSCWLRARTSEAWQRPARLRHRPVRIWIISIQCKLYKFKVNISVMLFQQLFDYKKLTISYTNDYIPNTLTSRSDTSSRFFQRCTGPGHLSYGIVIHHHLCYSFFINLDLVHVNLFCESSCFKSPCCLCA